MSAGTASVLIAAVTVIAAPVGALVQWLRERRRAGVDLVGEWEHLYAGLLTRLNTEIDCRRELEERFDLAMRRIARLERLLDAAGIDHHADPGS